MNSEQIIVKQLMADDLHIFQRLIILFHKVFDADERIMAAEDYLEDLLKNPSFIAIAATKGHEVLGGLTAYIMPMYYKQSAEAYIYDIAVSDSHQRKGIGRMLLTALKVYCIEHGIGTMFVEAHEEDIHAIDFYTAIGGEAEKVVHFNFAL